MKRKKIAPIVLILILLCAGFWFWRSRGGNGDQPGIFGGMLAGEPNAARLELQGNVEIREVRLGFEVPGRLLAMRVDEGDAVDPGQLVAELDAKYFEDALRQVEGSLAARQAELLRLQNGSREEEKAQAQANTAAARVAFLNAEKDFQRARELIPSNAISQERFESAQAQRDRSEAQLKAAEATQRLVEIGPREEDIAQVQALVEQVRAQRDEARRRLQDAKLVAPSAGIIQTKVHEPGDFVNVGEPVYTISLTNPVWVRTYINETDLGHIRPGQAVSVHTDGGNTFQGKVGFISPVAEFTPKTVQTREIRTDLVYRIRVVVQDPNGDLRQGMPVSVRLNGAASSEN